LDLQSFLSRRSMELVRSEEGVDAPGVLTLTPRTSGPMKIREASITVRRTDWHIIAKQVEMAGGPRVEAIEISYEVRDLPAPVASTDARLPNATARDRIPEVREPDPSRDQLADAEFPFPD